MQTKQGVRTVLTVYQDPIRTKQDRLCVISVHKDLIRIRKVTFRKSCVFRKYMRHISRITILIIIVTLIIRNFSIVLNIIILVTLSY